MQTEKPPPFSTLDSLGIQVSKRGGILVMFTVAVYPTITSALQLLQQQVNRDIAISALHWYLYD